MPQVGNILSCSVHRRRTSLETAQMEIANAFVEVRGFNHGVFTKLPKAESNLAALCHLTAASYELTGSDQLWYLTSDAAHTSTPGLARSKLLFTLYFKNRPETTHLDLLLVTQDDNCLYCAFTDIIASFEPFLQKMFDVEELDRRLFMALGRKIDQVQNRTVMLLQSAKNSNIDMVCIQVHPQNKGTCKPPWLTYRPPEGY